MHDIIEIKNIIPVDYQNHLLAMMTGNEFSWIFNKNMVSGDSCFLEQENNHAGFNHFFYEKTEIKSPLFQIVYPLVLSITSQNNLEFNRLIRMRANLTLGNPYSKLDNHMPHIDSFSPHWNVIYYVNDSDGDTVIFNETNDTYGSGSEDINKIRENKFTVAKRITPEKGKVVMFPGKYYHSSSLSKETKYRCVINMNFDRIDI